MDLVEFSLEELAQAETVVSKTGNHSLAIKAHIATGNLTAAKKRLLEAAASNAASKYQFLERDVWSISHLRENGIISNEELSEVVNNLLKPLTGWRYPKIGTLASHEAPLWIFKYEALMQHADKCLAVAVVYARLRELIDSAEPNKGLATFLSHLMFGDALRFRDVKRFTENANYQGFLTSSVIARAVAEVYASKLIHYGEGAASRILEDEFFGKFRDNEEIRRAIARKTADVTLPKLKDVEYYIKTARKTGVNINIDDVVKHGWEKMLTSGYDIVWPILNTWLDPQLRPYFEAFNGAEALKPALEKDLREQNVDRILNIWLKPPLRPYFEELGGERAKPYIVLERLAATEGVGRTTLKG
ncbi:MAG: hypothetical protein V1702_06470 [Candidatus Woesearchaeota archaeon]